MNTALAAVTVLPALPSQLPRARKLGHGNPIPMQDCARRMDLNAAAAFVQDIDHHRGAIEH